MKVGDNVIVWDIATHDLGKTHLFRKGEIVDICPELMFVVNDVHYYKDELVLFGEKL